FAGRERPRRSACARSGPGRSRANSPSPSSAGPGSCARRSGTRAPTARAAPRRSPGSATSSTRGGPSWWRRPREAGRGGRLMPAVRVELGAAGLARLEGAVVGPREAAIFRVEGSGALACLQGIFCNDLEAAGEGGLAYGGFLSPKGMILTDAWALRAAGGLTVVLPAAARQAAADLFRRSLPPRL